MPWPGPLLTFSCRRSQLYSAFTILQKRFGVPLLLEPEAVAQGDIDLRSVVVYTARVRSALVEAVAQRKRLMEAMSEQLAAVHAMLPAVEGLGAPRYQLLRAVMSCCDLLQAVTSCY